MSESIETAMHAKYDTLQIGSCATCKPHLKKLKYHGKFLEEPRKHKNHRYRTHDNVQSIQKTAT